MYKPKIINDVWGFNEPDFEYEKRIEIYVDCLPNVKNDDNIIRIIVIQEPYNNQHIFNFIQNQKNMYDYVFTYYDNLLQANEKATKFLCIRTWIDDYSFPIKKYGVSTIVGGKNFLIGHKLRHELWSRRGEIITPKYFYLSTNRKYNDAVYDNELVLGDKKEPLFDVMFHIAIENISLNNWFTEKLIDCFQTKTIPIHWGTPNINKYFNSNGMIIVNSLNELIHRTNSVTPEIYQKMLPFVEENYQRSLTYISEKQILDDKLMEIFQKNLNVK